jgi:DNA-binding transcriptional LysR family regulator
MKAPTDLRNIDLNLLLVFDVIYRTRNTTRAAEQLHLTQPAVSNALRRARLLFDDVLFVKTAAGMEPTPRAHAIASLVDEGFASIRLAVKAGQPFEPATAERTFRLYVSDTGQSVFIPLLAARLRKEAPGVRLVTLDVPLDAAQQMLKLGQMDLAIGMFAGLHPDFIRQKLFNETYAVLVRKKHPKIGARISADQFFDAEHVIYRPAAGSHSDFDAALGELSKKKGKTRKVILQLAHSFGIDRIVASSDLLACVPSRVAGALSGQAAVRALKLPVDLEPVDISQFWHERSHRDDGHQWLRSLIYEMFHDKRPSAVT